MAKDEHWVASATSYVCLDIYRVAVYPGIHKGLSRGSSRGHVS